MKEKRSIATRMLVLYVTFIIVVALAFLSKIAPELKTGYEMGVEMQEFRDDDQPSENNVFIYTSVAMNDFSNAEPIELKDSTIRATKYTESATIIIEKQGVEQQSPFAVIGNNVLYYIIYLLVACGYVWMLILIARIILSVRRSVIEERTVERSNIARVRLIGGILICSEIIGAIATWSMNLKAAELLSGSSVAIDISYSPDYWLITLGIVVLFMGELFAITHSLSEEQKLTI